MVHLSKLEITKMQIKRIEKELRDTPHHKGTDHHIGRMRAKLAKLRDSLEAPTGKGGGGGGGYAVKKQGDATVVLVGPPSAGKSTLINKLTNAQSKIAPYAFTTVTVVPGMMEYKEARIQILDVPGLIEGAEEGKGRGREVLSVVRGSDLLVVMSDVARPQAIARIVKALERNGIRVNKHAPNVVVIKKLRGGIIVHSNLKQEMETETIKEIAKEFGFTNCEITLNEKVTTDELIDVFSKNRVYVPAMYVLNKADLSDKNNLSVDLRISADQDHNITELKNLLWKKLGFVRVYLVRRDEKPGKDNPIIMKAGETLVDVARKIGEEFASGKDRAKIWGAGAKHAGQEVSLTKEIQDGMMVRFL